MIRKFIKCGIAGWCLEVLFTGIFSGNRCLISRTSLLMFPIYGSACLLEPFYHKLEKRSCLCRGFCYMTLIFAVEYLSGRILKALGMCPWDYSDSKYNIDGVIRLDFAPCWFFSGLLFEHILRSDNKHHKPEAPDQQP